MLQRDRIEKERGNVGGRNQAKLRVDGEPDADANGGKNDSGCDSRSRRELPGRNRPFTFQRVPLIGFAIRDIVE